MLGDFFRGDLERLGDFEEDLEGDLEEDLEGDFSLLGGVGERVSRSIKDPAVVSLFFSSVSGEGGITWMLKTGVLG